MNALDCKSSIPRDGSNPSLPTIKEKNISKDYIEQKIFYLVHYWENSGVKCTGGVTYDSKEDAIEFGEKLMRRHINYEKVYPGQYGKYYIVNSYDIVKVVTFRVETPIHRRYRNIH